MLKTFIFFCLTTSALHAAAEEMTIIDVRRNITLNDEDPVYKDFYISATEGSGLKKNLVVTAVRKLSIRDASGAQTFGEILIPVGQLRIIAIYNRIAVAREYKLLSRDELPMLEQIGIMTGDKIDQQGSFVDNSKPKVRKVSSTEIPTATQLIGVVTSLAPEIKGPAPASVGAAIAATTPLALTAAASSAPKSASGESTTPNAALTPHLPKVAKAPSDNESEPEKH